MRCGRILKFDWRIGKEGENAGMKCLGEDGGDGGFPDRRLLSDSVSIIMEKWDGQRCDRGSWGNGV